MSRRPNPPGWTPPRAPYNPYDPNDLRPAEGYPSEFNVPGKDRSWTVAPKEPTNYRVVKDTLKRLQYTPRPLSELYPGQYKVLRRTSYNPFIRGVRYSSTLLGLGVVVFGVFFYRWNDGYDHAFSDAYKWQLQMRESMFGELSDQQREDIAGRQRGFSKVAKDTTSLPALPTEGESDMTMQRPKRDHVLAAERIRQEREEAILRAVDIAEAELRKQKEDKKEKRGWW